MDQQNLQHPHRWRTHPRAAILTLPAASQSRSEARRLSRKFSVGAPRNSNPAACPVPRLSIPHLYPISSRPVAQGNELPDFADEISRLCVSIYQQRSGVHHDPDLLNATARTLLEGVYSGYGDNFTSVDWNTPDHLMLTRLTQNVFSFSAAKNCQEEVHVNAHIIQFPGMSGHADQEGLLKWAGSLQAKPDRVFVTHGEDKVTEIFAEKLWDEFRYPAMAPFSGTVFDLKENEFIEKTVGIPIQKETTANAGTLRTRSSGNAVFDRLVAAGQRLLTVITRNKGGANKDLSKFADQINSLCDKWDR